MTWEIVVIGCLVLVISGIAAWNMRKTKRSDVQAISVGSTVVDTDELARKIAKANAEEMRQLMVELISEIKKIKPVVASSRGSYSNDGGGYVPPISMDESVIPIDITIDVESTNLDNATTEEKVVDTTIEKSKSKLAGLFKKKNKE